MGTPIEWAMFWAYVGVMLVTHWAYRDLKWDADGVRQHWPLSDLQKRKMLPVTEQAVTHERFRLTEQFTGLVASALCLYLPGGNSPEGQALRTALLVLCGLMLLNTLHGVRARRRYFRAVKQMKVVVRKETA